MKIEWDEFYSDMLKLAEIIKKSGYLPDIIVPIMRGGLVPGAIMSELLDVKDVRPIDIERKGGDRWISYDAQGNIEGKNLLLVDEVMPTGLGPEHAKSLLEKRGAIIKVACLYIVPQTKKSVIDFYVKELPEVPKLPWKPARSGDRIVKR